MITTPTSAPCQLCGGRLWIVDPDGGAGTARRCECFLNRPIERKLAELGVGEDLLGASWDSWIGPKPIHLADFPETYPFICFLGVNGNGKSHASVAILRDFLLAGKRCAFIEVGEFFGRLKTLFGSEESPEVVIARMLTHDLVVLDEAYSQQESAWADEVLGRIIRGRLRRRLATVMNSNLRLDQLRAIEPRIASRAGGAIVEEFTGRDMRVR